MTAKAKILVGVFAYNEGEKIRRTLARHPPERPYHLLVMDAIRPTPRVHQNAAYHRLVEHPAGDFPARVGAEEMSLR